GLLYVAQPVLFVLTVVSFWLALIMWWAASAFLAPWLVVAGATAASGLLAGGPNLLFRNSTTGAWAIPVVYAVYVFVLGRAVYQFESTYRRKVASIPALNGYLSAARPPDHPRPAPEPSARDSEYLKWLFEMAMQPVDMFDGFDYGEQLHGGTCLRYQLNSLGAAVALAASNLLPNYPELTKRAGESLVLKNTDIRVWRYWRMENILRNLSLNP